MLRISEDTLEKAMAGLIALDWGPPVEGITPPAEGVAAAILHLLRDRRALQEQEARERLEDEERCCDTDDHEVADIVSGVPQATAPKELAKPPAGAIPMAGPRRSRGTQTDGPSSSNEDGPSTPRPCQDAGVQAAPVPFPERPSWEELEQGRKEVGAFDMAARQRRAETFEAFERYLEARAVPHPSAALWQRLIAAKREEEAHLKTWKAERQARLLRQEEEAKERARRRLEDELEGARDRRREEEANLQAARVRVEEARRAEERAAAELNPVAEHAPAPQPNFPDGGRTRYCCVCRWPGVRVPRRCPNAANHPPRPAAPPRG